MIVGLGIDITEVYRIRQTIARTPRFAVRVFTEGERVFCEGKGTASAQSYAGRFAAKEAFLKALQTGWRGKITWHDVEVVSDRAGAPSLNITGEAKKIIVERKVTRVHISISHTSKYAIAEVVLESTPE